MGELRRAPNVVVTPPIVDVLADTCARVRRLFSESRSGMSLARYDIGAEVRRVMDDEARYGHRAVQRLAESIGRNEDSLYDYRALCDAWPRGEFEALAVRVSRRGVPLSLSHFIALAKVPERSRDRLIERAFRLGLTVRQIVAEGRKLRAEAWGDARRGVPIDRVVHRSVGAMQRRIAIVERVARKLPNRDEIFEALLTLHVAEAELTRRMERGLRTRPGVLS